MRKTKVVSQTEKSKWILAQDARKEKRMKKYRLTKITVKTREVISVSGKTTGENHDSVCPVCHAPLTKSFPANESSAGLMNAASRPAELPPVKEADETKTKD